MKKDIIRQMEKLGWLDDWDEVWEYHKNYSRRLAEEKEALDEPNVLETMGFLADLMTAIDIVGLAPVITDDMGWDDIAKAYCNAYGVDKWTDLYWQAYEYMENEDPDAGLCFKMREKAIQEILKKCLTK